MDAYWRVGFPFLNPEEEEDVVVASSEEKVRRRSEMGVVKLYCVEFSLLLVLLLGESIPTRDECCMATPRNAEVLRDVMLRLKDRRL